MKISAILQKSLRISAVTAACLSTLVACGPKAADFSILPASQSSYQGSVANNKIDVLWVIDNSGSMLTKQEKLGASLTSFAQVFTTKDFDFRMAVVSTDMTTDLGAFQSKPYPYHHGDVTRPDLSVPANYGGASGTNATAVLTNSTPNLVDLFKSNVKVGDEGASEAKPLDAITSALSTARLNGTNTGFLRSDAHLAVIIVTDDDDGDGTGFPALGSTATVSDVTSFLTTLKPAKFDVISRTYKKNFTVSAVAVDAIAGCSAPFARAVEIIELVTGTNGSLANICAADFSSGLSSISQRIAEAITEIPLARVPNESTISVTFNGALVPNDATHGWTYSASGTKIVFHGNYIPTDNTSIGINYTPNDIIR